MILDLIKNKWIQWGGFSSKRVWIILFYLFWGFYVWLREQGFLSKKSVKNKHVHITGAGSGLGRDVAKQFAKLGANVTISDVNE